MIRYLLSMGSNLGNRMSILVNAIDDLESAGVALKQISDVFETEPLRATPGSGNFYNICLVVDYEGDPESLLHVCNLIESKLGRVRIQKNSPRRIDIDIVLANNIIIQEKNLRIPHPEMSTRKFVLEPAAQIAPDWKHPVFGKTVKQLLEECRDKSWLKPISSRSDLISMLNTGLSN